MIDARLHQHATNIEQVQRLQTIPAIGEKVALTIYAGRRHQPLPHGTTAVRLCGTDTLRAAERRLFGNRPHHQGRLKTAAPRTHAGRTRALVSLPIGELSTLEGKTGSHRRAPCPKKDCRAVAARHILRTAFYVLRDRTDYDPALLRSPAATTSSLIKLVSEADGKDEGDQTLRAHLTGLPPLSVVRSLRELQQLPASSNAVPAPEAGLRAAWREAVALRAVGSHSNSHAVCSSRSPPASVWSWKWMAATTLAGGALTRVVIGSCAASGTAWCGWTRSWCSAIWRRRSRSSGPSFSGAGRANLHFSGGVRPCPRAHSPLRGRVSRSHCAPRRPPHPRSAPNHQVSGALAKPAAARASTGRGRSAARSRRLDEAAASTDGCQRRSAT